MHTLTVAASFVNKVAQVEQGSPGSQILDKPLEILNDKNDHNIQATPSFHRLWH